MSQENTEQSGSPHYRPFTLAREGELKALRDLSKEAHERFTPIFVIPARPFDYDKGDHTKSMAQHIAPFPEKLVPARKAPQAFVDTSLLDDERPIHGSTHPIIWLVRKTESLGLALTPVLTPESSSSLVAAARALHHETGRGIALKLTGPEWPSKNPSPSQAILAAVGVAPADVDLLLDFGADTSSFVASAIQTELQAPSATQWRSVTVGGYAWPAATPADKGVSVLPRHDWRQYSAGRQAFNGPDSRRADFFDHLVINPEAVLEVDPRYLAISATFRYTTEENWLFSRGDLYKASQGRGKGGKAVPTATGPLTQHHLYGTPIRTRADDWIDNTLDSSMPYKPGNAGTWRQWATYRHIEVTLHSLSSLSGPSAAPSQAPTLPHH
ncbi:hypothetical protein [Arthrobacter sp. Y-9]|uniref:beta family protein n=1 Tax=Arthrobacter sp. Y-9 TaxID=3039385 RepID=UPI00241FEB74|nr:hypothetical protein [Arthrobacter sp. Y-9]WFR83474.1 hypothetical protein P9849_13050 [Arthrobacter sp. Y-9]